MGMTPWMLPVSNCSAVVSVVSATSFVLKTCLIGARRLCIPADCRWLHDGHHGRDLCVLSAGILRHLRREGTGGQGEAPAGKQKKAV